MQCGKGAVFSLGLLQLALVGLMIILFPPASTQVYVYLPCVANGTLTHACGDTRSVRLMLALPTLAVSAAGAAFVSNTFSLLENGLISEEQPFGPESLGQTGLWNALFWFVVTGAHAIAVAAACSPVDLFAWALATYLCVSFLARICAGQEVDQDGQVSHAISVANANVLGYMAGVAVAFYSVPSDYSNRLIIIFLMIVLDYFLGVGHVWEKTPSVETVANCRLFWACSAGLCLAALYGAWREDLLTAPQQLAPDRR
jgi:hypothetical protein